MKPSRDIYYKLGGGRSPVIEKRNFSKKGGAGSHVKRGVSGLVVSEKKKKKRYGERVQKEGEFDLVNMVLKGKYENNIYNG